MNDFERFQAKVGGGDDQSRVFSPCGDDHHLSDIRAIFIACEVLSERIAKLEERALKRKLK